jgi:hypothetical protein
MIEPVYRVRCDGSGEEWVAAPESLPPPAKVMHFVTVATYERAARFATEADAVQGAVSAGWRPTADWQKWLCPSCYFIQEKQPTA